MDRVASCRRVAREAIGDVEPRKLHSVLEATIGDASMTPAVLVLESAAATDPDCDLSVAVSPAAGVQLIYEGLRLTRRLVRENPWALVTAEDDDPIAADMEILAADILVARGLCVLSHLDAASVAVETVIAFGRAEAARGSEDDAASADADPSTDVSTLEAHVVDLAVQTGAETVGGEPTARVQTRAAAIADRADPGFPPAEQCLPAYESFVPDLGPGENVTTDRATSATDP